MSVVNAKQNIESVFYQTKRNKMSKIDSLSATKEEWIIYLENEVKKYSSIFFIFEIIGLFALIPMILCIFFGFPSEFIGYSFIYILFHFYIRNLLRLIKEDAKDRLNRWEKIYKNDNNLR